MVSLYSWFTLIYSMVVGSWSSVHLELPNYQHGFDTYTNHRSSPCCTRGRRSNITLRQLGCYLYNHPHCLSCLQDSSYSSFGYFTKSLGLSWRLQTAPWRCWIPYPGKTKHFEIDQIDQLCFDQANTTSWQHRLHGHDTRSTPSLSLNWWHKCSNLTVDHTSASDLSYFSHQH